MMYCSRLGTSERTESLDSGDGAGPKYMVRQTDAPVLVRRDLTGVDASVLLATANLVTFGVYTGKIRARRAATTPSASD